MFYNHPFEAWSQASGSAQSQGPSVFGALPYPADPSTMTSFFFTSYNPNIFNCTVVGPKAQPCYQIVTDDQMPGYTVVKDMEGKNVSLIEWQKQPFIEIRGMVSKQAIGTWLRLSPNKDSRAMEVRGMKYMWVPKEKTINLYAATSGNPKFVARINRSNGAIVLDFTPEAMQLGLLEPVITACLLMQCGRNID
ncbi:hypothetical protein H1R20_g11673, partial [Candolleomyces eurysporus]